MASFEEDPMGVERDTNDEDGSASSCSSSPSRQESDSRHQSAEYGQEDTEMNTANMSSFEEEFAESTLPVADLRARLSNATSRPSGPSFLGLDGAAETPLETSKAPSLDEEDESTSDEISAEMDHRLRDLWNLYDARKVTLDYGGEKEGLDELWKKQFGEKSRPKAYTAERVEKGEFLPMTDPEDFFDMLSKPESKPAGDLYAVTANVANVLKTWQDEHIAIGEFLSQHVKDHNANHLKYLLPQDPVNYGDEKEARLYGYPHVIGKRIPKKKGEEGEGIEDDKRGLQDAFSQGGFTPNATQLKRKRDQVGDTNNLDGWMPIFRNAEPLVPGMRSLEKEKTKKVQKPKYDTSGVGDMGMSKEAQATPAETDAESQQPAKRQTRSNAGKDNKNGTIALSKTVDMNPAETQTAPPTPPRRGRPPATAKPRGRPAAVSKAAKASASPKPPPTPPVPIATPHPSSDPGPDPVPVREKAARPKRPPPAQEVPSAQGMPTTDGPATTANSSSTNKPGALTELELATLEPYLTDVQWKTIGKSSNPARTKAMMLHWVKFRKEGRQRKPKRTKAEIEADKAANAQNGGTTTPKKTPGAKKGGGKPGRPKANAGGDALAAGQTDVPGSHQDVSQGQPAIQPAGGPILAAANLGSAPVSSVQTAASLGNTTFSQHGHAPAGGSSGTG